MMCVGTSAQSLHLLSLHLTVVASISPCPPRVKTLKSSIFKQVCICPVVRVHGHRTFTLLSRVTYPNLQHSNYIDETHILLVTLYPGRQGLEPATYDLLCSVVRESRQFDFVMLDMICTTLIPAWPARRLTHFLADLTPSAAVQQRARRCEQRARRYTQARYGLSVNSRSLQHSAYGYGTRRVYPRFLLVLALPSESSGSPPPLNAPPQPPSAALVCKARSPCLARRNSRSAEKRRKVAPLASPLVQVSLPEPFVCRPPGGDARQSIVTV